MAIDTAQKRRSMISFGDALYAERVPEATDFDSSEDRTAAMFLYAGFTSAPYVPPDPTPITWRPTIGASVQFGATITPSIPFTR